MGATIVLRPRTMIDGCAIQRRRRTHTWLATPPRGVFGQGASDANRKRCSSSSSDTVNTRILMLYTVFISELPFSRVVEFPTGYTFTPCVDILLPLALTPDRRDQRLLASPPKHTERNCSSSEAKCRQKYSNRGFTEWNGEKKSSFVCVDL